MNIEEAGPIGTQTFSLGAGLAREAASTRFAEAGRVLLPDILESNCAEQLMQYLTGMPEWNLVFRSQQKHYDLSASGFAQLSPKDRNEIKNSVYASAQQQFGYLYKNYPIFDLVQSGGCVEPLQRFYEFLNSSAFLDCMRQITGKPDIDYADAQATRYDPGHFLSSHDDAVAGKQRLAAFVLNLSPDWHPDWGGNLMFYDDNTQVMDVYVPDMNTLSLFGVGTQHAVSVVSPIASRPRLAITGWLRYRDAGPTD